MTIREKIDKIHEMEKEREVLIRESKTVEEVALLKKNARIYNRCVWARFK